MTKTISRVRGGMNKHSGRKCRESFSKLCRCLVIEKVEFFMCCGYHCTTCKSRIPEEKRWKEALDRRS